MSKVLGLMVFSTLKFFFSQSATLLAGYSFTQTIVITISGGYIGFVLFFLAGKSIFRWWGHKFQKKSRQRFSKRNRMIVRVKSSYGLWGIAVLTPCILSIPVGALVASYYYPRSQKTFVVFFICIVTWSLILTTVWSTILA